MTLPARFCLYVFLITLVFPIPAGAKRNGRGAKTAATTKKIKIKAGDNLHRISQRLYGDTRFWRDIAELNHLRNPNRILAGAKLTVPLKPEPEEVKAETSTPAVFEMPAE